MGADDNSYRKRLFRFLNRGFIQSDQVEREVYNLYSDSNEENNEQDFQRLEIFRQI